VIVRIEYWFASYQRERSKSKATYIEVQLGTKKGIGAYLSETLLPSLGTDDPSHLKRQEHNNTPPKQRSKQPEPTLFNHDTDNNEQQHVNERESNNSSERDSSSKRMNERESNSSSERDSSTKRMNNERATAAARGTATPSE